MAGSQRSSPTGGRERERPNPAPRLFLVLLGIVNGLAATLWLEHSKLTGTPSGLLSVISISGYIVATITLFAVSRHMLGVIDRMIRLRLHERGPTDLLPHERLDLVAARDGATRAPYRLAAATSLVLGLTWVAVVLAASAFINRRPPEMLPPGLALALYSGLVVFPLSRLMLLRSPAAVSVHGPRNGDRPSRGLTLAGEAAVFVAFTALATSLTALWLFDSFSSGERNSVVGAMVPPAVTAALAGILAYGYASTVTAPLRDLLKQLRAGDPAGPASADLPVAVAFDDDIGQITQAINHYRRELAATYLAIDRDLDHARRIQERLLPRADLDIPWVSLAGRCIPAHDVGGDFYDIFPDPMKTQVVFGIGDAAGKGLPAALLMAATQSLIRAEANKCPSPSMILNRVNEVLSSGGVGTGAGMYVTALVGWVGKDGLLRLANAGHMPPLLIKKRGKYPEVLSLEMPSPPLGFDPGAIYEEYCYRLGAGDYLVCCSDGITEATSVSGERFGFARLETLAGSMGRAGAGEAVTRITDAVFLHAAGNRLPDDATVLVLRVPPSTEPL